MCGDHVAIICLSCDIFHHLQNKEILLLLVLQRGNFNGETKYIVECNFAIRPCRNIVMHVTDHNVHISFTVYLKKPKWAKCCEIDEFR